MSTTNALADDILLHFNTYVFHVNRSSLHVTFGRVVSRPFSAAVHRLAAVDSLSVLMGRVRIAWRDAYDRAKTGFWSPPKSTRRSG